jgi:hypothetical protein
MPEEIAGRIDRACEIVAEAVLAYVWRALFRCRLWLCVLVPSCTKAGLPADMHGIDLYRDDS